MKKLSIFNKRYKMISHRNPILGIVQSKTLELVVLPVSMAAEISDWASLTLFIASSMSLEEVSDFRAGLTMAPEAWFNLRK